MHVSDWRSILLYDPTSFDSIWNNAKPIPPKRIPPVAEDLKALDIAPGRRKRVKGVKANVYVISVHFLASIFL